VNEDSTSFDVIYRDYYARIQRYLARLIGCDEAEDVTQEAFLRIARSLDGFRGESTVLTWVYRIATNVAMDRVRTPAYRASLNSVLLDESCETGESVAPVEDQAIRSEMSECVQGLVAQLPDHFRTVLVLSEMEDMKNSEIAQVLGISESNVGARLSRARQVLRELMEVAQ